MMPTTASSLPLIIVATLLLPLPSRAARGDIQTPSRQDGLSEMTPAALQESEAGPKLTPEELEAALEEGLERFEKRSDAWTKQATERWENQIADIVNGVQEGLSAEDRSELTYGRRHRNFAELPDELWHSYKYGTGVGNREELTLHGFYNGLQLNITGPALDAPPQWQVVSHRGIFFLFGLYPFAGTTKLHIVKTDFKGSLIQRTVDFAAADLRVTPFLHHMHSTQGAQLFALVTRAVSVPGLFTGDVTQVSEQVICFLVDQHTLETTQACSPVTLPAGAGTAEVLVDVLLDPDTGSETVTVIPVQQRRGLVTYRLDSMPQPGQYNLGLYSPIHTNSSVWKVRLFSVSGSTYVVVAYGDGPLDGMVQVFRHDPGVFSLVQTLSVTSIVIDIEVFSIGFQHYLALGQESRMSLYMWHYSEFRLIQDEPSQLTYKWTVVAVKSCRHEVILAKVFNSAGYEVEFFRHNVRTQQFEVVPSVPCVNGVRYGADLGCFRRPGDVLDLSQLVGVTADDATYIVIPSKVHELLLVTVNATVDFAPDPIWLQNERLLQWKAELQARYESLLEKRDRLQSVLERQVVPGSHQQLTGNFNFLNDVTANALDGQQTAFNRVHLPGYDGDVLGLLTPLTELSSKVGGIELAIREAEERITDAVRSDSASIEISGQKNVMGAASISSLTATGPVYINTVRGSDLNNTLSDMVSVDSDRLISGTKTVTTSFSVSSELTAALLNGRPVSDIVTTDTIQEVAGPLTYEAGALSVDTLSVAGLVGGVDTSRLALYQGTGELSVPVSITHLEADSLTVGQLNGQTPEDVFSNVLLRSGGTFTGSVTVEGGVTLTDITVNGTLNGEDAATCLSSIIYTDSAHNLDTLRLSSAVVAGSLSPQTVDSKPFPGGRYVTRGGSHVISGQKTFSHVEAETVTAARVDGVPVTQFVTLDTDQTLASLGVTSAHVLGDLTVGGEIDGVRIAPGWLDHLLANNSHGAQPLNVDVIFAGGVTHIGDLYASSINGETVEDIFGGLVVPEGDQPVTISGKKTFTASVTADLVTVGGLVNGADPRDWLTKSGEQLVVGPLILASNGFFANMIAAGKIDGVDITALIQDAVYTDIEQEQIIYGVKAFADPVIMSSLIIDGPVNEISPEEIMWTRGVQTVTGNHAYLGSVRTGALHAYGDFIVPDGVRIGGLDFSELPSRAATIANDTHAERLIFDKVIVRGDVLTDKLNGIDIQELTKNVLRRSGGRITGRWRFESLVVNGSISSAQGAGGYHLSQLKDRVVSLTRGGTLRAPVVFENLVVEDGGRVDGRVVLGGVPWEEVLDNLASQHQPITINASKTFSGGLHIIGQLHSPSLPLENLLLVDADQIITGPAFFHSDVTVHTDLAVQRPINGRYDVTEIQRLFVTDTDDVTIDGDLEIWGDASISALNISGLLANLPISHLLSSAVPLTSDAHLTGHLTFLSPVHAATLHLTDGLLNGRRLREFLSTVRLVTEDQVFGEPVYVENMTVREGEVQDLMLEGLLNGVNCTELYERLIFLNGNHEFRGRWTVPALSVSGDLSALSLNSQRPERLLRLDTDQGWDRLVITGQVYTAEVRNATGETRLNGYNLRQEVNRRVRLSSPTPQTLTGSLTFTGRVVVNGDVTLGGRINGFHTSQLVQIGSDNDVLANLQFTGPVTADLVIVRDLVDGVNITQCAASAVYPDRNHTLQGHYAITTDLEGAFSRERSSFDVDKAQTEVSSLLEQCEDQQRDFNSFFRSQCLAMRGLYDEMRSTYYAVRYFDELQELTWPDLGTVLSTLVIEDGVSEPQLLVTYTRQSGRCPETRLFRWRADSGLLQTSGVPYSCGLVRQWRHLQLAGRQLLVAAAGRPQKGCDKVPLSGVWLWNRGRIEPLQDLEIASTQVFYTAPRPGLPAQLRFLDPAGGKLHQFSHNSATGSFVPHPPERTDAAVMEIHTLHDFSLLLLSGQDTTVVARRVSPEQTILHEQTLGALTARALLTFSRRERTLIAVGDGGWSSLVNSPQGVKVFEYFGNGTHRCVPAQHLAAVSPVGLALLAAGSLPDLYLVVVERDCGLRVFVDKGEAGFVEFQRITIPGADSVTVLYPSRDSPPHLLVSAGRRMVLLAADMVGGHVPPVETDCQPRMKSVRVGEGGEEGESGGRREVEGMETEREGRT